MPLVVVVDYGYGNLHSVAKAVERAVPSADYKVILSNSSQDLDNANYIILPGVGAFADCIAGLDQVVGLRDSLNSNVLEKKKPFLGICVGMQLMAKTGYEHGTKAGLGWIEAEVVAIPKTEGLKIPHMGWNNLNILKQHKLFDGIKNQEHVYFVHSYYVKCVSKEIVAGSVNYGIDIPAIIIKDNMIGMQFHPEKSHNIGIKLLENFLKI